MASALYEVASSGVELGFSRQTASASRVSAGHSAPPSTTSRSLASHSTASPERYDHSLGVQPSVPAAVCAAL
eukprot:11719000-Alexandrium_andersonii.AAC.1